MIRQHPKILIAGLCVYAVIGGASPPPSDAQTVNLQRSSAPRQAQHYVFEGRTIDEEEYAAILKVDDATKDMERGDWATANAKLEDALKKGGKLYQAHSNHAVVLAHLGRLKEAQAEADVAAQLGPAQPEPLLAQAAVSQEMGKLSDAVKLYDDFLKRFPTHVMATHVRSLVRDLKVEQGKVDSVAKATAQSGSKVDDYFENATYEAVTKWDASRFPLKVFIPTDEQAGTIPGYQAHFGKALREAFADWQTRSNGTITFNYVPKAEGADIECQWTNDVSKVKLPAEGGEARVLFDTVRGIRHVDIIELTRHLGNPTPPSFNLMKSVALHEVGHSLGLVGHSPTPEDVMFCTMPAADEGKQLSERDVRTLAHLYQSDIKVADRDHGPTGGTDKASLNNDGVRLVQQQQFAQAAEKFEAALKIDPNYAPVRHNLAGCLNSIGIDAAKGGNLDQALRSFKRALEMEGPNGEASNRLAIMQNLALIYRKMGKTAEAQSTADAAAKLKP